ncbi:RNA polymerase sigma24 factor [Rhizocola hellebori]|uniref:RNA polymerase sigma24 factor n=1 Tax=Rhizocola hellebori TaxID=1392758 RepID=A0A8J3VEE8_9ACTN|nr:SigE family RNA polymerase sigma factor [Rhizocola hellebori]GIH04434.1 RNA polymerase sigma24 factor [Rhizocola hellebori]
MDRDFGEFYSTHFHGLTLQLNAYFGDMEHAQDVVQEAFVRAFDRWGKVSGYEDPHAWVRRVAWNLATSHWRRRRIAIAHALTQREPVVQGPEPDRVALVTALAGLPENQRRAMILFYLADIPIAEIALEERVPVGTVKSWLSRGRSALSAQLSMGEQR